MQHMLKDSKQTFDAIKKSCTTTERRAMTDTYAVKESYDKFEISIIVLISKETNLADWLTKQVKNNCLAEVMKIGIDNVIVAQWIERKE